jgi:putative transcriptional regulator|nr:MAG TPA: helix-turn-helix domain protein [Caudoviricetes sp.]
MPSNKEIGNRLKELRGQKTVDEVAKDCGISASALSMYENGYRVPRDDVKIKLAKYYGTSVGSIFFNE